MVTEQHNIRTFPRETREHNKHKSLFSPFLGGGREFNTSKKNQNHSEVSFLAKEQRQLELSATPETIYSMLNCLALSGDHGRSLFCPRCRGIQIFTCCIKHCHRFWFKKCVINDFVPPSLVGSSIIFQKPDQYHHNTTQNLHHTSPAKVVSPFVLISLCIILNCNVFSCILLTQSVSCLCRFLMQQKKSSRNNKAPRINSGRCGVKWSAWTQCPTRIVLDSFGNKQIVSISRFRFFFRIGKKKQQKEWHIFLKRFGGPSSGQKPESKLDTAKDLDGVVGLPNPFSLLYTDNSMQLRFLDDLLLGYKNVF